MNMEKAHLRISVTHRLSLCIISGPEQSPWVIGAIKVLAWEKEERCWRIKKKGDYERSKGENGSGITSRSSSKYVCAMVSYSYVFLFFLLNSFIEL